MIEMTLSRIVIDEKRDGQLIVLKEKNGERFLQIVIGLHEAAAIKLKLSGFQPPRPLTHDLLFSTITNLDAQLEKVVIDRLEENTFFAKLVLRSRDGNVKTVDARPSDSIALAVRAHVPIFVEENIVRDVEELDKNKQ
jgi:hypothetical protein